MYPLNLIACLVEAGILPTEMGDIDIYNRSAERLGMSFRRAFYMNFFYAFCCGCSDTLASSSTVACLILATLLNSFSRAVLRFSPIPFIPSNAEAI